MVYKIIVSPRAQNEIVKAIDFYALHSFDAPNNFILQLQKGYRILAINPFFRVQYKNVRSLNLKNFPYSLYYTIDENQNTVRVLSCFHNKRNPKKRP
ncbi:type II toxin-antitoxin system RelE/ParE family toxin [Flavobacterium nackdongense]|uniref:Type II toxin-antitoxin system RelE/ParE family toxin n=1 Tax=Flavobacterium nackdongense TaxID=2547394 RepID=A0A4P6YFY6_9FLAO|nr:type II toxin-antitoxin system RelE/ParE family toxin [Flavobacterium nackdongense]QBN19717.1 type II toxin-antitoxin system RelE/ParE family toxin [Flavobacterium nackdongense]